MTKAFFLQKILPVFIEQKSSMTICVLSSNILLEKGHGGFVKVMSFLFYMCTQEQTYPPK